MTLSYERGKTAVLYATFAKYGVPKDPTGLKVAIYYGGTVVIAATNMTQISLGYYYYTFNVTDAFELDSYSAVYTGTIEGITFKKEETFNVVAYGTLGGIPDTSSYYCTNADVRRELAGVYLDDIDNIDTIIADEILDQQEAIDRTCNDSFSSITETVWVNGSSMSSLMLPHTPIISISSCVLRVSPSVLWYTFQHIGYINVRRSDGIEVRAASSVAEIEAADLIVECVTGKMVIPARVLFQLEIAYPFWNYTFVKGENNIQVTYTHGFSATTRPREIRKLCALRVAKGILLIKGDKIGGGMQGQSADGYSKSYGDIPYSGRLRDIDEEIRVMTQRNRRIGVG